MCFKHTLFLFLVQKKMWEVNVGEKWNLLSIIVNIGKSRQYCLNKNINDISFVYHSPKTIKCTQKPKIEEKFTGIDQSSERVSAILHIISTTRSCACAQFTRLKTKNACKWSQYRPFSAESVRVWRVRNTLQKPTLRKKLMCSLKVKIPSLINCPLSPPPTAPSIFLRRTNVQRNVSDT